MGFVEAVEDLAAARRHGGARRASRAGRAQRRASSAKTRRSTTCWRRPRASTARQLKNAPRAIEYLKGRGLTGEIAARFGIGYAPDGWQRPGERLSRLRRPQALVEARAS